MSRQRPNILFILADDLGWNDLGASGSTFYESPHIDRIATEGALFRTAYSAVPSCTPARAGLLTGLSPWHHGMLGYGRVAEHYANEKPRLRREAGYYTAGFGKMHWFPQHNGHGCHELHVSPAQQFGPWANTVQEHCQ